jgi:hypothetical protein
MAFDLQGALQAYNNGGAASDLKTDFQTLAPGVTTIGAKDQGANFDASTYKTTTPSAGGVPAFLGGVLKETGHLASQAATWLGKTAINMVEAPVQLGAGIGHGILDHIELNSTAAQSKQLSAQMESLQANYRSGHISKDDYTKALKDISQGFDNLVSQTNALNNRVTFDQQASTKALINTASDLVTVLTVGFGKALSTDLNIAGGKMVLTPLEGKTATDWLASAAAKPFLDPVVNTVQKLASQPEVFKALDATTQQLLQKSAAEVIANAGSDMTAAQIARATAANVALKYPIIYGTYINPTASEMYNNLDQGKYGDAMRSIAFNAALLLSGGPIGQALKYGGDALKGISAKTFGQTSFWDELSAFYGDGRSDGFSQAIAKYASSLSDAERTEFVHNLSAVEATNVAAMGGDTKAGAYRLAKGMQGQYAFNLSEVSHDQAIQDMVNFSKSFRDINDMATKLGIGPVAVGRLDVRDKEAIAKTISGGPDVESRLNAWEGWKQENPNSAAANNANFDKQVKQLIEKNVDSSMGLMSDVMAIKARPTVEGFPADFLNKYAKQGYIPIKPKNLEAPFKEGTGAITTRFANTKDDIFVKSVQPLPILNSIGAFFTHIGLSPNASQSQVYQLFNDALARNLASLDAVGGKLGASELGNADLIIKQLSSFAHDQKLPVKDLRMLSVKQISEATGSDLGRAKDIQNAIAKAHLQVPLAVKGLGDRAVDWSYKLPVSAPIMRQYLKIQGAMRFSFNPFFQYLRVIPKTEILTEAEGGGYVRSIFSGRGPQISQVRDLLHSGGFLDKPGFSNVTGDELQASFGSSANIHKKLLPAQEKSIAGLIDSQAQRMGMDAQTYMSTYPNQVRDTVQMIAEYDRNANFLNSPLMRTLNVAFFPMRFDTKVATIFAKNLGKAAPITQVAVMNGMLKAHDFLNSPQGQAWYQQNADVIGLINYITPMSSMAEVFSSLLPGHDHSLGNFGQLGGLPFGWIPQLLDSEGITHFNQPGMNAKTGQMFPNYIPATAKGQLAIGLQDLLGQLFSYPGAQVGLTSKSQLTGDIAKSAVGAKTSDFTKVTPQPNAQQRQYANNIKANQPAVTFTTGQPSSQPVTFGMQSTPTVLPKYKNNTPTTKKKKESEYTPALLPGQTGLGQL